MANVLRAASDSGGSDALVWKSAGSALDELYLTFDLYIPAATMAAWVANPGGFGFPYGGAFAIFTEGGDYLTGGTALEGIYILTPGQWQYLNDLSDITSAHQGTDEWHTISMHWKKLQAGAPGVEIDATDYGYAGGTTYGVQTDGVAFGLQGPAPTSEPVYLRNLKLGTSGYGSSDVFSEDFSGGDLSGFDDSGGDVTVIADPTVVAPPSSPVGRVLIAFDDGPLEPSPTWTRIDDTPNLVSGYDIHRGKQTLLARTDTGTATVYINDTAGLFDPANSSSPYFGKLDGKQIMLQCWNPVTLEWVPQFRGTIDDYGYDINPATDSSGNLLFANIQVDCVDVFDYLGGYGLTPGLDGVAPPVGSEGTIWYAETAGTVDDRIIEALTDAGIDSTMWVVFTGNVSLQATNYDADEAMLTVLRDAADAEFPGIANIYVDKTGRFVFHGRYSRFTPDLVAADATPGAWNFMRWKIGDGQAITADPDRAQMRVLQYSRARSNVINAALCYPKGIAETDIPGQVYADATSIAEYGKHALPPVSDLIIKEGTTTGNTANVECKLYAELTVKNQKDPRVAITLLTIKAIRPDDPRGASTWNVLTGADISDIANIRVGYPGGTGIGDPGGEDYYIEGVTMRVRPLQAIELGGYDYVELDLDVSPAVWSTDSNGVFGTPAPSEPEVVITGFPIEGETLTATVLTPP